MFVEESDESLLIVTVTFTSPSVTSIASDILVTLNLQGT